MAKRSRRREKDGIHPIAEKLTRDFGGGLLDERPGVVYGSHEREMPPIQRADDPFFGEPPHRPKGENTVEVGAVVGEISVRPCEFFGAIWDLPI